MAINNKFTNLKKAYRVNGQITAKTVRLLDEEGKQIGVLDLSEAQRLAREQEIDLVEVAPHAVPPVVKIIDFNKFLYQLKKKKHEEKLRSATTETKEIRVGLFIGEHDLDIKLKKAREFIQNNDKVKLVVLFRGREMGKQNIGRDLLTKVIDKMQDIAKVEREMHMEGRRMVMVLSKAK